MFLSSFPKQKSKLIRIRLLSAQGARCVPTGLAKQADRAAWAVALRRLPLLRPGGRARRAPGLRGRARGLLRVVAEGGAFLAHALAGVRLREPAMLRNTSTSTAKNLQRLGTSKWNTLVLFPLSCNEPSRAEKLRVVFSIL